MKKKDQISFDEEVTLELQAEFDEEERLAKEKVKKEKEANIDLIEEWDDIQAKIDVDYQLAERLQAQEQEELSVEEKAKLFQQLLEQRRKYFAAKSSEEEEQTTNPSSTKKNHKMFDRAFKRVNTFVDFRTDLVEDMMNKKLQVDYFSEMAYQLLKLLTKQLKNQSKCLEYPIVDNGELLNEET
ncbi:hypothetical protein Tco_1253412 [Tanacetum coccineum]